MAKADFTFDEMVYNSVVAGQQFYYKEHDGPEELKTIDYVKLIKNTRQIEIHCIDGDIMLANQDEVFTFEVTTPKLNGVPNRSKVKKVG